MLYTDEAMERERVHRLLQPAPKESPWIYFPAEIRRELPVFQPCKKYMRGVKFPVNKSRLPVLTHTLVQVKPGHMILRWIDLSGDEWKEGRKEVTGEIMGHCNMCLPSRTIKALFRVLDGNPIIFSEDQYCQITTITTIDSVIRIKGIDKDEWPRVPGTEVN